MVLALLLWGNIQVVAWVWNEIHEIFFEQNMENAWTHLLFKTVTHFSHVSLPPASPPELWKVLPLVFVMGWSIPHFKGLLLKIIALVLEVSAVIFVYMIEFLILLVFSCSGISTYYVRKSFYEFYSIPMRDFVIFLVFDQLHIGLKPVDC